MQNENKINTRQITINMIFSILSFVFSFGINFFIAPYITEQFGSDAYGFVKLAIDFTNYASLFSIALNSMASRFLMIELVRGNTREAQKYFSSIVLANIVLTIALLIPSIFCVMFLDSFLVIPEDMVSEVKLTFAITFAGFLGSLFFSTYSNCYYLTNKLSIGSVRDALMNIIRVVSIILLFVLARPRISYVAMGSFLSIVFCIVFNIYYTKKLIPEFIFKISDFDFKKLWKVLSSGIWNSITKLSQIFSSGLDLMVTNMFIGSVEMGYLAIAKTIPNVIISFNATVANVFSPNMMELYAKKDIDGLRRASKTAMKFMCLFVTIPNAILITMGREFYGLWVPDQPSELICILAVLTVVNSCITGPLTPLYQIFTITNKIRQSSTVLIIYGFSSIFITYLCLLTTDLGLFAVTGVSLIGSFFVALGYHLPFAAIYIGLPWYTFFPEVGKGIVSFIIQCILGLCICRLLLSGEVTWLSWFICAGIDGCIGIVLNVLLVLNKEEKKLFIDKFIKRSRK